MSQRQYVIDTVLHVLKRDGGVVDSLGSVQTELATAGEVDLSFDAVDLAAQVIRFIDKLEARRSE